MTVLRRPRPDSLEAVVHESGARKARIIRSFEDDDLPRYDGYWDLLLDSLEDFLILVAWMFLILAAGILIFR